ncbi:DUF559 domain-containing protein [Leptolyngbya sp. FACHB-36]|uniref:DUF559 domain-containing protein n=1 Tax=Leptolyngbya sp. FACHB-36 TaxID=2692808 RepID=UPI0016804A12|nr:DUF559 domain-containing protein [Leptolyngbya sp. FACHB-36]MBD2021040.1 DUF559 domain-containing protein [Leptolyngbya sp. FACHB-36]
MDRFPTVLIPDRLKNLTGQSLESVLRQTDRPEGVHHHAPKGHSETQFERDLWRYFPGKIHSGLMIRRAGMVQPYVPDFAYIDPALNLHVDIEVDEPYTHDTRLPLHYVGSAKDDRRNEAFLAWGWVVIRFSEVQVVQSPASCCKTIAATIATLTGDSAIMSPFRDTATLKLARRWTEAEAAQLAEQQWREQYLTPRDVISCEPAMVGKRKRRHSLQARGRSLITTQLSFYCPTCGEGPIRWQGHYVCCPTCGFDQFVL